MFLLFTGFFLVNVFSRLYWYLRHWNSPSLIFVRWQPGQKARKNNWPNISLYVVPKINILQYGLRHSISICCTWWLFIYFIKTSREYFTPVLTSIIIDSKHFFRLQYTWFQQPLRNARKRFIAVHTFLQMNKWKL